MIGASADNAHTNSISLIPTGIAIDDVNSVSCVQVVNSSFSVDPPDLNQAVRKEVSPYT